MMENKLIDWLNKTGYPLELWTESILSQNSFITSSSTLYEDEENKIFREIDLIATKDWEKNNIENDNTIFSVELIIECKKSDKPFVLLCNQETENSQISIGEYYGIKSPNLNMLLNNPNLEISLPQKSSKGFKLIQGFVNGDETINKAINSLLKAFNNSIKNNNEIFEYYIEDNINQVSLPILIIDALLYEAKTLNSKLTISPINSAVLNTSTKLSNFYPDTFPITIIVKSYFNDFLKQIEEFGEKNIDYLVKNPQANVMNIHQTKIILKK